MARRARQHMTVELFPFLAVLVCVMGSLIFLLLVMTKRMRAVAVAKAQAAQVQLAESQRPMVPPIPVELEEPPEPAPLPEPAAEMTPIPAAPAVDLAAIEAERQALRVHWETRVADLSQALDERQAALQRQQLLARASQRSIEELKQQILQRETELAQAMGQLSAAEDQLPQGALERSKLEQQIAALRRQLKQLEQLQQEAQGRYAIVPFDGKSGTTRRPLLIECTSTGLRFLPEDITLTPADIEGFTPQFNPLAAGTNALVYYWSQPQFASQGEPYVMLIVRPNGTLAYYIAMKLLSSSKRAYGYELVTEDMQLQTPPVDPQAKALLEAAIARSMQERQQALAILQGAGGGSGRGGTAGPATTGMPARSATGTGTSVSRGTGTGGQFTQNSLGGSNRRPTVSGPAGNAPRGNSFSMDDLTGGSQVGERSWEDIERFEGQNHRRQRTPSGAAGSPSTSDRGTNSATGSPGSPPRPLEGSVASAEPAGNGSRSNPGGAIPAEPGTDPAFDAPRGSNSGTSEGAGGASPRGEMPVPGEESGPPLPEFIRESKPRGGQRIAFSYDQLQRRKWGSYEPGASIGVEKNVRIRVDSQRLIIGEEFTVAVPPGASRSEIFDQLILRVDQLAHTWGQPGPGFFWVPRLEFIISPGGNTVYERISPLVTKSGLSNRAEHTLESSAPAALEARP